MVKFYISFTAFIFLILCSCAGHKKRNVMPVVDTTSISDGRYMDDHADNDAFPYNNVNKQIELYQQHVSFYAFNQTDGWELFIKDDSSFTFELNGTKTVFEYSKANQLQGVPGIRFSSKRVIQTSDTIQKKNITITLIEDPDLERVVDYDIDPPFNVEVIITDGNVSTGFSGAGFYVGNPVINDIWVLDSLSGIKFSDREFPHGRPRLEFHLRAGSLYGFSGCSDFSGGFYFVRNKILFSAFRADSKSCTDASDEAFLALLSKKRFEYAFQKNSLKLTARDGSAIIFRKVD